MEDSWRFQPITQPPALCPTCSSSHFPFCPPPPSFNPSFHRQPYFDPIPHFNDQSISIRPTTPFPTHRDSYYQPTPHFDFLESDRIVKRMRVGNEVNYGLRFSVEDERRLSLIRDHGAPKLNGYSYESSFGDWQNRPGSSNSFYDSRVTGGGGGGGQILHQDSGFDYQNREFNSRLQPLHDQNDNALRSSNYVDTGNNYYGSDFHQFQTKAFNQGSEFQRSHMHSSNSPLSEPVYESKQNIHIHRQHDARQSFEVKYPPADDFQREQYGAPFRPSQGLNSPTSGVYPPLPPLPPPYGTVDFYPALPPLPPPSETVDLYPALPPLPPPSETVDFYPAPPPLPPPSRPMEPPGPPPVHLQPGPPPLHLQSRVLPPSVPLAPVDVVKPLNFERQTFQLKSPSPERPKVIDASSLFKRSNRDSSPDHIVVILRGLPGSGKSYLAKMLRDLEVENGANAPRIHSMDDYFMTEVEKIEESEISRSSGSTKGKKRVTKMVMEYCYEPEMEEAYRLSMLKAFKKTLEDGIFTFIIVDDRNLRIADFAQFWATAKRSGYEVYLLEAVYKDPVGCAARNIHGFTSDEIQKMAEQWEEAPSLYLRLDIQSLFHGDDLKEHGIQEVDMDMDDVAFDEGQDGLQNTKSLETVAPPQGPASDDSDEDEERWDAEEDDPGVKELGKSKWSHDADEEDIEKSQSAKRASNALSGLIQAYTRGNKSVHWGDKVGKTGFSIGAHKRANVLSLVIGPGSGYNLKSNPLPEEENVGTADISWQSKKRSVFEEQLRAERASERESFKAGVDKRRQRIHGLELEDDLP